MNRNNPNEYRNPRRINEPLLIFAWPAPKVMPCLCLLGAAMIIGHIKFFLGLCIVWWILYGYLTERHAPGIILHYLWWSGWTTGLTKECSIIPDPMKREFFQ